ncbi:MAG: tyrosine-type recombinase/integrase [Planctomycetaceae bacterium]|nr:tyrosine-type recombinase/integrase [Planctomycetaceae bacterium]
MRYNKNIDKSDQYAIKRAFYILLSLFPDNQPKPDTGNFKVGYIVMFQKHLIKMGFAKSQNNRLFKLLKRVFSWGAKPNFDENGTWDKLPTFVSSAFIADMQALTTVSEGKTNPPRSDVEENVVRAVFPFVSEKIADMLQIQLLTGMRPKELCNMCVGDIKRTKKEFAEYGRLYDGINWIYVLKTHKTEKKIGAKAIPLGIEEQDIINKYWNDNTLSPIFKNKNGKAFTRAEYGRKIKNAIDKNELQKFVPYQIRHTSLTEISAEHGRDIARAVAGHTTEKMTAIYDHSDIIKALYVVNERNKNYRKNEKDTATSTPILRIYTGE